MSSTLRPKTAIRISQIKEIIKTFNHDSPLSIFLKQYFRKNKKIGSKDRKQITEWSYSWFRLGSWNKSLSFEERLAYALFLNTEASPEKEDFLNKYNFPETDVLDKKVEHLNKEASFPTGILPFQPELSEGVSLESYQKSLLVQPQTYIHIKQGAEPEVVREFDELEISYTHISEQSYAFNPKAKLTQLQGFKKGLFWIQDLSSQGTAEYFKTESSELWWDCCCGAGGKSLLYLEQNPDSQLIASDNRKSILENYAERMEQYGFENSAFMKLDLSNPVKKAFPQVDGILADVPCSGSGTWARSPENISTANPDLIAEYQSRQRSIVENALPFLRENGHLVYITCSVFKQENELNVQHFMKEHGLKLLSSELISGTERGSDTLFVAKFQNFKRDKNQGSKH